jgi:Asp-tRNA(Asn)/Glu-tRNA(Gln) amidotransferase B subunit
MPSSRRVASSRCPIAANWKRSSTTVLAANPKSVEEFRAGKDKAFNALVGQVMKASKGKANPAQVNDLLKARLQN